MGKTLRKPKGVLLTLVGLVVFVPWLLSIAFTPQAAMPWDPEKVRRFGPLALLFFAVMTLMFSSGERGLFFTPAEIDFLFPGPFSRRSLLAYKVTGVVFGILFSSLLVLLATLRSSRSGLAAYAAIVLTMLFYQLLGMAVGLASNTIAAFAIGVRRRAVLAAVFALLVAAAWSTGSEVFRLPLPEAWARVESSSVIRAATLPFKPFIYAWTAPRLWPDAAAWLAVSLGMVAATLAAVFAIDAQYFETSAASSARIYAQLQRMRQGGGMMPGRGSMKARRPKSRLTMLPWWGGVGPVLWRQLATALREKTRLVLIAIALVTPALLLLFVPNASDEPRRVRFIGYVLAGTTVYAAGLFSAFVAFDFRGDVDRMQELKSLPIRSVPLVLGQLATPVLVFVLPAWLVFAVASPSLGALGAADVVFMAILAPLAALFIGVDNLLFLVFPTRSIQATPADFATMGRQILLIFAKLLLGGLTIGLAAVLGWLVQLLFGGGLLAAYLVALAVVSLAAASLVPFLALAFDRYDVASDAPG
jgi:hypothetical protein